MRRIFTLMFLAVAGALASFAQVDGTFQFVDKAGNVIPDGSVVTATTAESDGFDGVMIKPDLYVKANSLSPKVYGSMTIIVEKLDGGYFQVCFPANCDTYPLGTHETMPGEVSLINNIADLQSEWVTEEGAYGSARAKLQVNVYSYNPNTGKYTFVAAGPSVTVECWYIDPAGVEGVTADGGDDEETARYSLDGRRLTQPERGLNIVRTASGKVRKVVVK